MFNSIGNDKRFWMNLIKPSSKKEMEAVDRVKLNLRHVQSFSAFLSLVIIVISQFEYEFNYYIAFYKSKKETGKYEDYDGLTFRLIYLFISLLLGMYQTYKLILN
jgi:hypothetical protein